MFSSLLQNLSNKKQDLCSMAFRNPSNLRSFRSLTWETWCEMNSLISAFTTMYLKHVDCSGCATKTYSGQNSPKRYDLTLIQRTAANEKALIHTSA
jgi:hypothetical protein